MAKLTREQKIEIYEKRKYGYTLSSLSKKFNIATSKITYLVNLIDKHGINILREEKNKFYTPKLKQEIMNKVLIEKQSVRSTAIKYGLLSDGLLPAWIKSYKDNGYVIVEKTKGRKPTMKQTPKDFDKMTDVEKIKYLQEKNLYLEAENEYLKKLRAVVQARKNQQQKKK